MKGDFSRFSFNPKKRYSSVRMQQGRVQLDADWNEQLDITAYRIETEIKDFIGQSGTPEDGGEGGFKITVTTDGKDLNIGKGRYYVDGMLFENQTDKVTFTNQVDLPQAKLEDFLDKSKPDGDGIYLAYLDVWQHHITALEDPDIREVALGEADTATRTKNVWQVKLQYMGEVTKEKEIKEAQSKISSDREPGGVKPLSTGKLSAQVNKGIATLENQLYRVEIHTPGKSDTATFKWSRDNGSVAANVKSIDSNTITVNRSGQDAQTGFAPGQWVELVELKDKGRTLRGEPGILVKLEAVEGNKLTVKEWPDGSQPQHRTEPPYTIVRRWDSVRDIKIEESSKDDNWILLENEIEVKFDSKDKDGRPADYKTGDYWLIPARHLTGNIDLPPDIPQEPHGILHRYCRLALLKRELGNFTLLDDYRFIFKPLRTGLLSKAGDTMTGSLTINEDLLVKRKFTVSGDISSVNDLTARSLTVGENEEEVVKHVKGKLTCKEIEVRVDRTDKGKISVRGGRLGIGTETPSTELEIKKDATQKVGPIITLTNHGGQEGSGAAIDFNGYDVEKNDSTARIQTIDDGKASSHIVFSTKIPGKHDNERKERMRITSVGNVIVSGNTDIEQSLHVKGSLTIGELSEGVVIAKGSLTCKEIVVEESLQVKGSLTIGEKEDEKAKLEKGILTCKEIEITKSLQVKKIISGEENSKEDGKAKIIEIGEKTNEVEVKINGRLEASELMGKGGKIGGVLKVEESPEEEKAKYKGKILQVGETLILVNGDHNNAESKVIVREVEVERIIVKRTTELIDFEVLKRNNSYGLICMIRIAEEKMQWYSEGKKKGQIKEIKVNGKDWLKEWRQTNPQRELVIFKHEINKKFNEDSNELGWYWEWWLPIKDTTKLLKLSGIDDEVEGGHEQRDFKIKGVINTMFVWDAMN